MRQNPTKMDCIYCEIYNLKDYSFTLLAKRITGGSNGLSIVCKMKSEWSSLSQCLHSRLMGTHGKSEVSYPLEMQA